MSGPLPLITTLETPRINTELAPVKIPIQPQKYLRVCESSLTPFESFPILASTTVYPTSSVRVRVYSNKVCEWCPSRRFS